MSSFCMIPEASGNFNGPLTARRDILEIRLINSRKYSLRDHQRGCRGGNRFEKGGFRNLTQKGYEFTDKAIN